MKKLDAIGKLVVMLCLQTKKKEFLIFYLLAVVLLIAGCSASTMAGYESAMKEILKQAKTDLASSGTSAAPNPLSTSDDKKVTAALENVKNKLDAVNPPDELFAGHSDIKEFIELTIESRKGQGRLSAAGKGRPPQPRMDFALVNAARQALDRAKRELPFLDYELSDAFSGVLRPTFAPSQGGAFGMPSGMGAPGSQSRQSPIRRTPSGSPIRISPPQQKPPAQ